MRAGKLGERLAEFDTDVAKWFICLQKWNPVVKQVGSIVLKSLHSNNIYFCALNGDIFNTVCSEDKQTIWE